MMRKTIFGIITILLISSSLIKGQEDLSISESRKKNLQKVLDYRFKGGYYSFERLFNKTVEYPEVAAQNCVMGIIIASFNVNCDGEIEKVALKTMLRYGIDEEVTKFFNATTGQWNTCDDDKYTHFDIPIQFRLEDVKTNTTDAILVKESKTIGYVCHDDDYFVEKINKYLEKGKGKKALQFANELILRNPYNNEYIDMRTKALSLIK
jgi:hypothetical protein